MRNSSTYKAIVFDIATVGTDKNAKIGVVEVEGSVELEKNGVERVGVTV